MTSVTVWGTVILASFKLRWGNKLSSKRSLILEAENDLLELDFQVILNLQMICCGHNSLHILDHLILFQVVLSDLQCESELLNQLTLPNQVKFTLLLQCPLKWMSWVPHSFIYKLCRHFSIQEQRDPPHHLGLSGVGYAVVHGGWGLSLLGISQVVQHHTDAGLCWFMLVGADHSCRPYSCSSIATLPPRWEHIPLPSQSCCGCSCLQTGEQVRCKLQFGHKNSWHLLQSRWGVLGLCASPGWAGWALWWGFLCLSQVGRSMDRALAGLLPSSARFINSQVPCCVTLWSRGVLSPVLSLLFDSVSFSPPPLLLTKFTLWLCLTKVEQCKDNYIFILDCKLHQASRNLLFMYISG